MGLSLLFRGSLIYLCLLLSAGRSVLCFVEDTSFSFSFQGFQETQGSEAGIALYGDAAVVNSSVRITKPRALSRGRVMYRRRLAFGRKPSFSTYFSFSISPQKGDGLAFLIAPSSVPQGSLDGRLFGVSPGVFAVEFDTSMDSEYQDPNANHVGVDLGSATSVIVGNVSKLSLVLNSGEKLHAWIDYEGDSKILEVSLSKSEFPRPSIPVVSFPVDLSGLIWKNSMTVGIASSSGNSTQSSALFAWNFALKHAAAYLMHSEPLDPRPFFNPPNQPQDHVRRDYLPGVLIGLAFGAVCGAMVIILALFAWTAFMYRRPLGPVEYSVHPVECENEKMAAAAAYLSAGGAAKA